MFVPYLSKLAVAILLPQGLQAICRIVLVFPPSKVVEQIHLPGLSCLHNLIVLSWPVQGDQEVQIWRRFR